MESGAMVIPMTLPRVSVVIVTFNHENFIRESILSVINQGYDNLEIIVSDDCSTDHTPEIVKQLAREYPAQIVPIFNAVNLGVTRNLNQALKKCTGELFFLHDG